jgi:hypothetical protein
MNMVVQHGITMEPHPQNVLMEVGENGMPTGNFLHRDFGGFNVDFNYREQLGMARPQNLPTISDMAREYHVDENESRLRNLSTYFQADFLYNLDHEMPTWSQQGWIDGDVPRAGTFERMVVDEVDSQVSRFTGTPADLRGRGHAMPDAMRAARAHQLARRAATRQRRALSRARTVNRIGARQGNGVARRAPIRVNRPQLPGIHPHQ